MRARHAVGSRLRTVTCAAALSTVVAVPLITITAPSAAAHPRPAAQSTVTAAFVAPAPGPGASPVLRQGTRGAEVVDLQRRLGLAPDGVFGPNTLRAVRTFQAQQRLTADGIVGARTWAALRGQPPASVRVSRSSTRAPLPADRGAAVVAEAARHAGKPYVYGATGPSSFDCSGLVQYVYRQVGVSLPRTSAQQAAAARPVRRGSEQLGDLIIFRSRGTVTHVGIYAGDGTMWVARRPGTTITRQSIYTSSYSVGRVL